MKDDDKNLETLQNAEILSALAHICEFLNYEGYRTRNPYVRPMRSHASKLKDIYLMYRHSDLPMPNTPVMNPIDALKYAGDGNPGAMAFVSELFSEFSSEIASQIVERMLFNDIKGQKLYILWNDCCERNTAKTGLIALTYPISEIERHINLLQGRGILFARSKGTEA